MKKAWRIAGLLAFLVIGAGVGKAMAYGGDDRLPEGFYVGGLALGGMHSEEAIAKVKVRIAGWENAKVGLAEGNGSTEAAPREFTLKQLGLLIDAEEGLLALERYRDHSWWERAKLRLKGIKAASYGADIFLDESALKAETTRAWGKLVTGTPVDATRAINERDEVVYTPETYGKSFDADAMYDQISGYLPQSLASPPPAKLSLGLMTADVAPKITLAKLKEEGIERKISEFTTSFETSGEGRSYNVTAAANALNETLLMPEDVFEYGNIVAKADKEYGYKEAPVIVNGKLTPGIGGGICQVSSTLYNAILTAGLDVVERRNHSLVVHYLPAGLDATFADGYINFKFRNSTGKQLLIRTVVKDKTLTVKLFGSMPDNVEYRTETVQVKVNPQKTVFVGNAKLRLGGEERLQSGEPGFVVDSYRIKTVDAKVEWRKRLSRDTYRPQDALVAVNPADPRLNPESDKPTPGGSEGPVEPV